jgi:tetratricopeptide (TPR) repeat protein
VLAVLALPARDLLGAEHEPAWLERLTRTQALYEQGAYEEATPVAREAVRLAHRQAGWRSLPTARCLVTLGQISQARGRLLRALHYFRYALDIQEELLGPEHLVVSDTLVVMAKAHLAGGDPSPAQPLLQSALEIREARLGSEHPKFAESMFLLGGFYLYQPDLERAGRLLEQALRLQVHSLSPEHPEVAKTLSALEELGAATGKQDLVGRLMERVVGVQRAALVSKPVEPGRAATLVSAQPRTVPRPEATGGAGQTRVAPAAARERESPREPRGLVPEAPPPRRATQARRAGAKAPSGKQRTLQTLGRSLRDRAETHARFGEYHQAASLFQGSLELYEQAVGLEHPDVAELVQAYAAVLRRVGRVEEAAALEARLRGAGRGED